MGGLLESYCETGTMASQAFRQADIGWENHLLGLSGLITVASLALVWKNPTPTGNSIPEVIVPLGVSLGLGLYTFRLKRRNSPSDRSKSMVKYAWAGALFSGAVGGFWMALHYYYGLPIDVLPDKILTVLSLGVAAGVLVGRSPALVRSHSVVADRHQVVAETTWTTRQDPTPIASAVVDTLAEADGTDPRDLEPLYAHVDPDALAELRSHDGTPWQFTFYTDDYEVRVSSHGAVTVYRNDRRSA